MADYTVSHHRAAAKERDWLCSTYGQSFRDEYAAWMSLLGRNHGTRSHADVFDLERLLDDLREQRGPDWLRSLSIFRRGPIQQKLQMLLAVLREKKPPRQLRADGLWLPGLDGDIIVSVGVMFEIIHDKHQIIILQVLHHAS